MADQARTAGTLFVFTPDPMPEGWRATSVSYVPGRAPTWHLGMLTDQGSYVGIEESLATEQDMVEKFVDPDAERGDKVRLRGLTWREWTDSGGDYALVLSTRKQTVLVGGSAGEKDVRALVGRLSLGNLRCEAPSPAVAALGAGDRGVELLPGAVEPGLADLRQLLAALPQRDRLGEAVTALLEASYHLDQLVARLLVGELLAGSSRSPAQASSVPSVAVLVTVAPIRPSATRTSRRSPAPTDAGSVTTSPPAVCTTA